MPPTILILDLFVPWRLPPPSKTCEISAGLCQKKGGGNSTGKGQHRSDAKNDIFCSHWVFLKVTLHWLYGFTSIQCVLTEHRMSVPLLTCSQIIDHPLFSRLIFEFFVFRYVSDTSARHYHMEVFSVCARCKTYLYLRTMEQMVWEKDLSCMVVQGQTLSQHFLAGLYVGFMLYLLSA